MRNLDAGKNTAFYFLTVIVLTLLFKDFFKIMTYFIPVNINYIFLPCYAVVLVVSVFFILKRRTVPSLVLLLSLFFSWNILALLVHFFTVNRYGYDFVDLMIVVFFQGVVPIVLVCLGVNKPQKMFSVIKSSVFIVGYVNIAFSGALLIMYLLNPDGVIDFFVNLMKKNLIVNPIQTHEGGIELRFSGIFYSAYTFALYCNVMILFSLFYVESRLVKGVLLLASFAMLLMSFNRNGMALVFVSLSSYLCWRYFKSHFSMFMSLIFCGLFAVVMLIPLLLNFLDFGLDTTNFSGAYTKISTLMVRFIAWNDFLSISNIEDILLGKSFVQGIANTDFFIDNGFYYFISQTGLFSFFIFFIIAIFIFMKLIHFHLLNQNSDSAISLILFCGGLFSMMLNNSFYENIFLVYFWVFPIVYILKCERLTYNYKV
ncbi:hypothetical protein ACVBKF_01055 [Shewanella sp. 0m-11]